MKKCPYCAEKIQNEAIICRYCGNNLASEFTNNATQIPNAEIDKNNISGQPRDKRENRNRIILEIWLIISSIIYISMIPRIGLLIWMIEDFDLWPLSTWFYFLASVLLLLLYF